MHFGYNWKSSRLFLDIWQILVKAHPCTVTPSHRETLMSSFHSTQNFCLRIEQAKKVNIKIRKVCFTVTIWFTIYPLTLIWKTLYSKMMSSLKMYLISIKNQIISMYIIVHIQFLKYMKIYSHNQIHYLGDLICFSGRKSCSAFVCKILNHEFRRSSRWFQLCIVNSLFGKIAWAD